MPVEPLGHHERTARAADAKLLARPGLLGPGRGRAVAVQHEFDLKLLARGIEAARRVVARGGPRHALGELDAVGPGGGQHRRQRGIGGEKDFHMVVKGRGHEVLQVLASEGDARQEAGNALHAGHGKRAHLQVMAHALYVQVATGHQNSSEVRDGIRRRTCR
ncbi:hypothetical protein D3C72_1769180 [compost metagenome]